MKKKINVSLVGIAVLAIIATIIGITFIYYNLLSQQVRADLAVSAKLLKDTHYFESVNIDTDKIDLSTNINELRVTWIDKDGKVLYDNDASAEILANHADRPEIRDAFEKGSGEVVRKSDTMNRNTYYYAVLLDNGTVLRVATDVRSMWSVFFYAAPVIILIILVIITVCIVISRILTRQLLKPIENMVNNLENADYEAPYKELEPLAEMVRTQHADVLSAAKARQDFTANVSHELKTPLTAIRGYAELLEGGMVEEGSQEHFYTEIRKNSDRLLALIDDIIRLSELDPKGFEPHFEDIDMYEVARDCMDVLRVNADKYDVSIYLEGESCNVYASKDMLKELLENLAQNAIRYNKPGGEVVITIGAKDDRPVLTVRDTGIGIPLSEQERIFERFYTVDKSRSKALGGTGLGLAIVRHIVELHNAKIELHSEVGVGTTISVVF